MSTQYLSASKEELAAKDTMDVDLHSKDMMRGSAEDLSEKNRVSTKDKNISDYETAENDIPMEPKEICTAEDRTASPSNGTSEKGQAEDDEDNEDDEDDDDLPKREKRRIDSLANSNDDIQDDGAMRRSHDSLARSNTDLHGSLPEIWNTKKQHDDDDEDEDDDNEDNEVETEPLIPDKIKNISLSNNSLAKSNNSLAKSSNSLAKSSNSLAKSSNSPANDTSSLAKSNNSLTKSNDNIHTSQSEKEVETTTNVKTSNGDLARGSNGIPASQPEGSDEDENNNLANGNAKTTDVQVHRPNDAEDTYETSAIGYDTTGYGNESMIVNTSLLSPSKGTESHENPFTADGELSKKAEYIIRHSTISRSEIRISDPDLHKQVKVKEEVIRSEVATNESAAPLKKDTENGKVEVSPKNVEVEVAAANASQPQPQQAEQVKVKSPKCKCCVVM